MKIKRSIFATVSGRKINPDGANPRRSADRCHARPGETICAAAAHRFEHADGDIRWMLFTSVWPCAPRPSTNFCPMLSSRRRTGIGDADLAARRLAAWRQPAPAASDSSLFERRLERDGLSLAEVVSAVRRGPPHRAPRACTWLADAIWIEAALQSPAETRRRRLSDGPRRAMRVRSSCSRRWSNRPRRGLARISTRASAATSTNRAWPACATPCCTICPTSAPPRSTSASPKRATPPRAAEPPARRHIALRSIRRRYEGRRLPPPVRRQAGAVAADRDPHAAMDRHVARIRRCASTPTCRRSAAIFCKRQPAARSTRSKAISPTRTMAAVRS